MAGKGGRPPPGHPRGCKAKCGCGKWALKGSSYCQFHGGRRSLARNTGLPRFYRKHLGPTLRQALDEMLEDVPREEQVQLYEELALMRTHVQQAVKLASPVFEGKKVKESTRVLALSCMRDALDGVRNMCLAVSKIEAAAEDKVSLTTVNLFVAQIVRAVYRVCGEEHEGLARRIEAEIESGVRVPKVRDVSANVVVDGTAITPDSAAAMMDESVCGNEEVDDG